MLRLGHRSAEVQPGTVEVQALRMELLALEKKALAAKKSKQLAPNKCTHCAENVQALQKCKHFGIEEEQAKGAIDIGTAE